MKKQVIRLTESDLHNIINEAVTNVLIEEGWFGDKMGKAAGWARNQLGDFWNSMKGGYQQARANNPYANKQYGAQAPTTPQQNTTTTPQGSSRNNSFGKPTYGEQPNLQNYNPQNFGGNGVWGNNQQTTTAAAPQATQAKNPRQGNSKVANAAYERGQQERANVPQDVKQKGTQMFNNVAQLEKDFMDLAPQLQQMGVNTRQVKSQLTALTNVIANFAENKNMKKNKRQKSL